MYGVASFIFQSQSVFCLWRILYSPSIFQHWLLIINSLTLLNLLGGWVGGIYMPPFSLQLKLLEDRYWVTDFFGILFSHKAQYSVSSHLKEWLHCTVVMVVLPRCGSLNDRLMEEVILCCHLFSWTYYNLNFQMSITLKLSSWLSYFKDDSIVEMYLWNSSFEIAFRKSL